ncbi:MAG: DUF167 domain-containing protein [Desulfobacterales bacterium]
MSVYEEKKDGLIINVFIQPRSSRNQVAGLHGDALKLKITAPPVEGEANRQCLKFLAKALGLPKSALKIAGGDTSRSKRIFIRMDPGPDLIQLKKKIDILLSHANPS